jgi:hypothetical protein
VRKIRKVVGTLRWAASAMRESDLGASA